MNKILPALAFSVILLAPFGLQNASAQESLYGLAHSGNASPSSLYQLDSTTGAANLIGPTGFNQCGSMDYDIISQTMFATCHRTTDNTEVLVTVDLSNGAATEVGPAAGGGTNIFDISFRNSDNTLFGVLFGAIGPCVSLMTLDINSGAVTEIGDTTQCNPGNGLAFSLADVLYHFDQLNGGTLYTVNTGSGVSTPSVPPTFPPLNNPRINAMDTQPSTGVLFASVNDGSSGQGPNYLGTVNINTGIVAILGQSVNGLDAIAFAPQESTVVAGEIIQIDQISLILAGAQSFSWMIPALLAGLGIGLFVVSRKSENYS